MHDNHPDALGVLPDLEDQPTKHVHEKDEHEQVSTGERDPDVQRRAVNFPEWVGCFEPVDQPKRFKILALHLVKPGVDLSERPEPDDQRQKDEDDDNESDTRTSGYGDEKEKPQKIFSMKRKEGVTTSRIGNLLT